MNPLYVVLVIAFLVIAFLVILFFSGRVTWRFYQQADKTNRILIVLFAGGALLMGVVAGFNEISPLEKSMFTGVISIIAFISNGALWILIGREIWGVYQRIRLIRLVNTLEEPEEQ